ncbi:MAG: transposase [Pyrinomonadaceae bacterium]
MSHTHFLYHIVFGTKDRLPLIEREWEPALHAYLGGIVRNHSGKPIEIGGMPDYVHLLVRLDAVIAFPDFLRELKARSSRWVRKNHSAKFNWQRRYGAFTVSESVSGGLRSYIRNQKEHHMKRNFEDEYKKLLRLHNIDFEERYLWG